MPRRSAGRPGDRLAPAGAQIADQVRALAPQIGAVTELGGRRTLIWRAGPSDGPARRPARDRLVMATGAGWLEVLELQEAGRNA